jgi:hypothetical protein
MTKHIFHHLYRTSIADELVESTLANVAAYYDVTIAEMQEYDTVRDAVRTEARSVAVLALRELGAPMTQVAAAMSRCENAVKRNYIAHFQNRLLLDTMHALLGTQHGVMLGQPVPEPLVPRVKPASVEAQIEPALRGLTGSELYWTTAYVNVVLGARKWDMCGSILHGGQWLAKHPVVLDRVLNCLHDPCDRNRLLAGLRQWRQEAS